MLHWTRTNNVMDSVAPRTRCRYTSILLFIFCGMGFEIAHADIFPQQLVGAWGARAEYQGDDRSIVASKACDSYKQNPEAVSGDVIVFRGSEKLSYGGYSNYVDKNISVRRTGADQWQINDRHYEDGEGERKVGYRNTTYTVSLNSDILTIKEGKLVSRYIKCMEHATQRQDDIVPLERGFYVKRTLPAKVLRMRLWTYFSATHSASTAL